MLENNKVYFIFNEILDEKLMLSKKGNLLELFTQKTEYFFIEDSAGSFFDYTKLKLFFILYADEPSPEIKIRALF